MVKAITDRVHEFYINNNDMDGDKPNFTTYNNIPLGNGTVAINMDTKKVFFWDEEDEEWK